MRAMILAAGRGQRMGAFTTDTPKPLLKVAGRCLIEYVIDAIKRAHIDEIVINISYKAEQIKAALGDGARYGVSICYSEEPTALETGGGIVQALPLLGDQPFLVCSGDIISDYPLAALPKEPVGLGHLVMVDNPAYRACGDFSLENGYLRIGKPTLTFANISVWKPAFFQDISPGRFPLSQLLLPAIRAGELTGEYYQGQWSNVGTPDDLFQSQTMQPSRDCEGASL
ncbi:MAG TPA: nucleotidyltransferase family protein [Gammaproteobacteria bacterium]|jgi:MurNAc alpha-1-phosphate uridylyltransferase|nr:nucleotidyltransferase family protein [Gammaproteobacteria bacterium]